VQGNSAVVHADPTRVAVGGDSAGGNLAAVTALAHRDLARRIPLTYQALVYPGTDHAGHHPSEDIGPGYLYDSEMRDWFRGHYLPNDVDRADWRISPLRAPSHEGLPPALVVTAEYDPLRDEGDAYAAALMAAGVPVEHVRVDGMTHGFVQYNPIVTRAREVLDGIGRSVGKALA
jgi:acetyl esterase